MNQKKNDFEFESFVYEEEVPENELYSKVNVDDRIYVKEKNVGVVKWLVVLAIILMITSLGSSLYGFLKLSDESAGGSGTETIVTKYNLFVEHSNSFYGGKLKSFEKYSSLDKSFVYDFNVSNNNPAVLDYSIDFVNSNFGNDNVDMSLINYSLMKNDVTVATGVLQNINNFELFHTDILSNTSDDYVIKIWSDKINKDLNFEFQINVRV